MDNEHPRERGCFFVGKTDARLAPGAGRPLIGMKALFDREIGMRNEGSGFAMSIYGAMPEGGI